MPWAPGYARVPHVYETLSTGKVRQMRFVRMLLGLAFVAVSVAAGTPGCGGGSTRCWDAAPACSGDFVNDFCVFVSGDGGDFRGCLSFSSVACDANRTCACLMANSPSGVINGLGLGLKDCVDEGGQVWADYQGCEGGCDYLMACY